MIGYERDACLCRVKGWVTVTAVLLTLLASPHVFAEEPAEAFLNALRDKGYYDEAIRYLDGVATSITVSADFKRRVEFEKAKILIDSSSSIGKTSEQESRLDQADQLMTAYVAGVNDPIEKTEVLRIQANIKVLRGQNYLAEANKSRTTETRKQELFEGARKLFGDAIPIYQSVLKSQTQQVENFLIDPADPDSNKKNGQLQASRVDTQLRIPLVLEKQALAFGQDVTRRNSLLAQAASKFEAVADSFEQSFVRCQIARAYAARCHQQAGNYTAAMKQLKLVFDYPKPARALVLAGLKVGINVWPKIEPYPFIDVIKAADGPVSSLNRRQKSDPTWQRIQLELARAKHERSVAIVTQDSAASKNLQREALRLAREIAQQRGPNSKLAAEMLGGWGVSFDMNAAAPETVAKATPATSFADALQRAIELSADLSDRLLEVSAARRQLRSIKDNAAMAKQQQAIEQLQSSVDARAQQGLNLLAQAVAFSDTETPRVDLNRVRYLQAYCYYAMQRYDETAVIGTFLLQKYPTIDWSQQAAGMAVSAYEKIFDNAQGDARDTAKRKLIDTAAAMLKLWANAKESSSAAASATRVAVVDKDFESAREFFDRVSSDSPLRGQLSAKIGQQIWSSRRNASDDQQKTEIARQAVDFLQIAFDSAEPESMDFVTAVSSLYLADANRELGNLDKSIEIVNGLLENVTTNPSIRDSAKFRRSLYVTSLNSYLAAMKQKPDVQQWVNKSKVVIEKMSTEAGNDPAAIKTVSRIYRKFATDLKDYFDQIESIEQKEQFADSLISFFAGVGSTAKDGKTRLWAGSTLLEIGESLKLSGGSSNKSRDLFREAIKLINASKEAGFGGDKSVELKYRYQLALAQRGKGDFQAAVKSFETILETDNSLSLQIDAAKTLLFWGVEKKNKKALVGAMNGRGDYRDPKTRKLRKRIWGWKRLVDATRGSEKLRRSFQECEYYSVLCRFRYGQIANSQKAIDSARNELNNALKRFSFLAEGVWKKKYETLQQELRAAK